MGSFVHATTNLKKNRPLFTICQVEQSMQSKMAALKSLVVTLMGQCRQFIENERVLSQSEFGIWRPTTPKTVARQFFPSSSLIVGFRFPSRFSPSKMRCVFL